jgi:hypothetical protein
MFLAYVRTLGGKLVQIGLLLLLSVIWVRAQHIISWDTSEYTYEFDTTSHVSDGIGGTIGVTLVPTPDFSTPAWLIVPEWVDGTPSPFTNNSDMFLTQANMTGELSGLHFTDGRLDSIRQIHEVAWNDPGPEFPDLAPPYTYTWVFDFSNYNAPEGIGATLVC